MADILTVADLEAAKKHDTFHSEVITGKVGGLTGGADIDTATNSVTGQVQKTLPKLLDDLDWSFVGKFVDGVTFTKKSDFAIDASGTQWIYVGASPFPVVVAPATVPSAPDYQVVHISDHGRLSGRNNPDSHPSAAVSHRTSSVAQFIEASAFSYEDLPSLRASTIHQSGDIIKIKSTGLMYEVTNNPETVPGFAPSLMTQDDDSTFVKFNSGPLWAKIIVSSGTGYVASKWHELYGKAMHKFRLKKSARVVCFGDSITFGQGTVGKADSVNRIGDPTNFGDGSTYNNWQLITPYPKYLQSFLSEVYGDNTITVDNRGYSGDSVYQVVKRHITPSNADIGLLMIGINDCAYATNNHADEDGVLNAIGYNLDAFKLGLQQVIIRETLRGVAMILMTCESQASNVGFDGTTNSGNVLTEAYNDVIRSVGNLYGIPVVETIKDVFANYPIFARVVSPGVEQLGLTHDGVHLDPYGAEILAARLAAVFGGKGVALTQHKPHSGGCKMLPSYAQDSVVSSSALMSSSPDSFAPFFLSQTNPQSINLAAGQSLYFVFYTDQDDVIVHPAGKIDVGGVATFTLDFGVEQPEFTLDVPTGQKGISYGAGSRPVGAVTIEGSATMRKFSKRGSIRKGIHVATRGWHTIRVLAAAGGCEVYGLQFTQQDSMTADSQFVKEYQLTGTLNNGGSATIYTSSEDYEQIIVDVRVDVGGTKKWLKKQLTKIGASYAASDIIPDAGIRVEWSGDNIVLSNDTAGPMLTNFTSVYIYRV